MNLLYDTTCENRQNSASHLCNGMFSCNKTKLHRSTPALKKKGLRQQDGRGFGGNSQTRNPDRSFGNRSGNSNPRRGGDRPSFALGRGNNGNSR